MQTVQRRRLANYSFYTNGSKMAVALPVPDQLWCMAGVDWGAVEKYVDLRQCYQHYLDPCYVAPKVRTWYLPWTWCYKPARCALTTLIGLQSNPQTRRILDLVMAAFNNK